MGENNDWSIPEKGYLSVEIMKVVITLAFPSVGETKLILS